MRRGPCTVRNLPQRQQERPACKYVRTIYIPTGLAVVSTEVRSQQMNKKLALNRLCEAIAERNEQGTAQVNALNRLEHTRIQRGNPRERRASARHRLKWISAYTCSAAA